MPDPAPAPFDPAGILRVLQHHGVDYVLIGGVAARLHGSPTLTEDVDVTPNPTRANLGRLAAALSELGARLAAPGVDEGLAIPLDHETFSAPVMKFLTRLGEVDVVRRPADVTGVQPGAAKARSSVDTTAVERPGADVKPQ